MKHGIHPDYHPVVFQDRATGTAFLTRSTATSDRTVEWAGDPGRPPPNRRLLTRESLTALLEPAGFGGLRFVERDFPVRFETPEQHRAWMWSHGMRALFESVPADRADEAEAAFLTAAAGVPELTYRVRFTVARKVAR